MREISANCAAVLEHEEYQGQDERDIWYPTRRQVLQAMGTTESEYDDCNDGASDF
jgi:hypothetical protein